jgi:hypothetical protein
LLLSSGDRRTNQVRIRRQAEDYTFIVPYIVTIFKTTYSTMLAVVVVVVVVVVVYYKD